MSQQPKVFKKSKCDLSLSGVSITITDAVALNNGQTFVDQVRNRSNASGWATTGSTDAANTTLEVDLGVSLDLESIILVDHNWKAFTIKYWTGSVWADFSTAIAETVNTDSTTEFTFTKLSVQKIQIIITGAQVVDDDKFLAQLLMLEKLESGQFDGWPMLKKPVIGRDKKVAKALSGKVHVVEKVGAFAMNLEFQVLKSDADLTLIEAMFLDRQGFVFWPSGGDATQFSSDRVGYRLKDIYYLRPTNEWSPEWKDAIYQNGMKVVMNLGEAL